MRNDQQPEPPKFFDIAAPGRVPTNPTSRPVPFPPRPARPDPMMRPARPSAPNPQTPYAAPIQSQSPLRPVASIPAQPTTAPLLPGVQQAPIQQFAPGPAPARPQMPQPMAPPSPPQNMPPAQQHPGFAVPQQGHGDAIDELLLQIPEQQLALPATVSAPRRRKHGKHYWLMVWTLIIVLLAATAAALYMFGVFTSEPKPPSIPHSDSASNDLP